ncbi:hypothetical protein V8C86DRAFT_2687749 [Haematococcus lacustris]
MCAAGSVALVIALLQVHYALATHAAEAVEWQMELLELVAVQSVDHLYCKASVKSSCALSRQHKVSVLKHWASRDSGWDRLVASLSLTQLAHRLHDVANYQHALEAGRTSSCMQLGPIYKSM